MAINKAAPMRFTPRGVTDAFDATDKFPGACQQLSNLVFDPSNPELVYTRPGVTQLASFATAGFITPGFISVQVAAGTRVYGMIASGLNAGKDQPFCYDLQTMSFVPITGITGANSPTSPSTAGDWIPPTIASVGTMVIVTHPGFDGTTHFFGWIDVTNPAAPVWNAGNTATHALPGIPVAVANFNNRAYFAVPDTAGAATNPANQLWYTDALTNPPTITNATQFLVIGDSSPINALAGLPIQTTSSGVLQTLTVFKQQTQIWQVSGDTTFSNLSLNYVSLTIGTNAPRSVVQTPSGMYFSSSGGPYFIDLLGTLRTVTHSLQQTEPDIVSPFQNAISPTRWAGAYNASIYRVCGPTIVQGKQSTNDYWFDERKRRWNGPHTFAYDCASSMQGFFILTSANNPGLLLQSVSTQPLSPQIQDLGTDVLPTLLSATFPKTDWMAIKQVAESQIELSVGQCFAMFDIDAEDEQGNSIGDASITITNGGKLWGTNNWGVDNWGCPASDVWGSGILWGSPPVGSGEIWGAGLQRRIPQTVPVPWPAPLVFEKMQLKITVAEAAMISIGTFYARYQKSGYMTMNLVP